MTADRARAADLGVTVGQLAPGPLNAITDVAGVLAGHTTLIEGTDIRTGVTAIVPGALHGPGRLAAGVFVGNGFGKMTGTTQVSELGVIETPIVLTATLATFRAADALITYMHGLPGNSELGTVNPVVAETNDMFLSDLRRRPVSEEHVLAALHGAAAGPVAEGAVGAGTGTGALGYKGGIGTSSRTAVSAGQSWTVGALAQTNFGGTLTVAGVPLPARPTLAAAGIVLGPESIDPSQSDPGPGDPSQGGFGQGGSGPGGFGPADPSQGGSGPGDPRQGTGPQGNSCVIILATDAPLDARQLTRVARRAIFAMARVGSSFEGNSGDYALAFSTAPPGGSPLLPDTGLDQLFVAAMDATEEAILNSLFMAQTTTGFRGHIRHAVPLDAVRAAAQATRTAQATQATRADPATRTGNGLGSGT